MIKIKKITNGFNFIIKNLFLNGMNEFLKNHYMLHQDKFSFFLIYLKKHQSLKVHDSKKKTYSKLSN